MTDEMATDNMSNEVAIEVLKDMVFCGFDRLTPKEREALDLAIKSLEEKPQGHWINSQVGQTCNLCNEIQFGYDSFRHFCPNCGAKMHNSV